jgi:hypothetical protein
MTEPSGPSAGVLGDASRSQAVGLLHSELGDRLQVVDRHPRAGHDRDRWRTVSWLDYRVSATIGRRVGAWSFARQVCVPGDADALAAEADSMPYEPGTYTALMHDDRGLVMSDSPGEVAGCLPFFDAVVRPAVKNVLIGGLGLGVVPGWLLRGAGLDRVDVVEYDEDVIRLLVNDPAAGWTHDARLHIYLADVHHWQSRGTSCWLHRSCTPRRTWEAAWWDIWDTITPDNLQSMRHLRTTFDSRVAWQMCWEEAECEAMEACRGHAGQPRLSVRGEGRIIQLGGQLAVSRGD